MARASPFVYLLFLVWLVVNGAGAVSLDALVSSWWRSSGKLAVPVPESPGAHA